MMDDFLRQCADNRVFRAFYTLPPLKNNDHSYVQDKFYYTETHCFSGGNNETVLFTINTILGVRNRYMIYLYVCAVVVTYIVHCAAQNLHKITYAETS